MRVRWWPATAKNPKTCATFAVLRQFQLLNCLGKVSAHDFVGSLELLTNNDGLTPPPVRVNLDDAGHQTDGYFHLESSPILPAHCSPVPHNLNDEARRPRARGVRCGRYISRRAGFVMPSLPSRWPKLARWVGQDQVGGDARRSSVSQWFIAQIITLSYP
jgi:hypothetical protein